MTEHVDVIIVGAGLSGIGAAYHLQKNCPGKTYAILEGRGAIGGTWDLFRYPGIRSDSDMHTLGYNFKPWTEAKAIADGPSIRAYVQETADENGITPHIQFHSLVKSARWSSATASWTVEVEDANTGARRTLTGNFLSMCSGYYSYTDPHKVDFKGQENFNGQIVHPQFWPEDLDYAGKKVVVIGSGATAMTLVPSMAPTAGHVTMIQRSPTWVASRPTEDALANFLRKIMPSKWAYALTRWKNTTRQQMVYERTRTDPDYVKGILLKLAKEHLPAHYVDQHFTPTYNPWDQRLCLIPDHDLFKAINDGKVSVITNTIDGFTENGVQLTGGEIIEADIIVTATGLQLLQLGGVRISVDGREVDFSDTWTYQGAMYSDVPNLASTFGYINASWTLRADLIAEFVCRLLNRMDETGTQQVTPRLRDSDKDMPKIDWIENFSANYMKRHMHEMPKQGDRAPWINPQNFAKDKDMFRRGTLDDGVLTFTRAGDNQASASAPERQAAE